MSLIKKTLPLIILLLAWLLQTGYLVELRTVLPHHDLSQPFCGVDAVAHQSRAWGLLAGTLPGDQEFYFTPLYPFYLAIFNYLWGEDVLWLTIYHQALLQILGLAALYGLGRLLYGRLTGMLAILGLATYNYYLFYLPCYDQALLTTPFLTLALFLVLHTSIGIQTSSFSIRKFGNMEVRSRGFSRSQTRLSGNYKPYRLWLLLLAGLAFAIAILSRPTVLMVLPVVIGWLWWQRPSWTHWLVSLISLLIPISLAIAPLTWHNYRASGEFFLISNNFGINLFTGNNPDAYGLDSLAHAPSQPAVLRFRLMLRRKQAGETTYLNEVLTFFREQPAQALALTGHKTWLWFGETEKPLVEPFFPRLMTDFRLLAPWPLTWQALMVVAGLGLLFVPGKSRPQTLFLVAVYAVFSLFTIIFFIQLRFRLPFVPFVILLAASVIAAAPWLAGAQPKRFWSILTVMLGSLPFIPGLTLFIGLFILFGWGRSLLKFKAGDWLAVSLMGLYLMIVGLWTQANTLATDVSQTIDHYLGPPLVGPAIFGQTFRIDCDRLHQIELTWGTFNDQSPQQPVTFVLATDTSAQEILYSETVPGETIQDYQRHSFRFPPINDSANRQFFFFVTSPDSTADNALTVRGYSDNPNDYYPPGQAFVGRLGEVTPLEADFAFTATCDLSWWQKIRAVFNR